MPHAYRPSFAAAACFCVALVACAGESSTRGKQTGDPPVSDTERTDAATPAVPAPDAGVGTGTDAGAETLQLEPSDPTLRVKHGKSLPTLQFQVRNSSGTSLPANFTLDDGALGTIDAQGLFTPTDSRGGQTWVEARVGRETLRTKLRVTIAWAQNGATADPGAGMLAGGYAGVGGEGPGGELDRAATASLDATPRADTGLKWLYPYDGTLFPLGLPAPLLMWTEGSATALEGISIHLSGQDFDYRGYFGRPPALAASAPFVRHPIPEQVWAAATNTVAGGTLTAELRVTKAGVAYGPITQAWSIARGSLKGTVYYQSYGTHLAENTGGAMGGGTGRFGGATLSIRLGATAPQLVAGGNGDIDQCRVCHSVSADGSRMLVQHGDDYTVSSSIDLQHGNTETGYPAATASQLAWIGLTPDGTLGLANGEPLGVGGDPRSGLYDMNTGDAVASKGLLEFVREAAFPVFAHDGKRVAFNFFSGSGSASIGAGDGKKLVAMDFDPMTRSFSNPVLLYGSTSAAGWPGFSPTGTGVVYQLELTRGSENLFFFTRLGATGELWWTNLRTGKAHALELANGTEAGVSYLPVGAANHAADHHLNYEPSVAPIASGGYAWMVFTSRRMYGNVATIDPWYSDPRDHDLTQTPTTKKLWIAGIDLDLDTPEVKREVGDDPSHPAFYLPGQELLAGNARGFWVVDPCRADRKSCQSGVDCCSGVCQKDAKTGDLTCGPKTNECVEEFGRCESVADCCDQRLACLNHVCTQLLPQ